MERLLRERRISQSDVSRYVGDMKREISELEQRLHSLREAAGHVVEKVVSAVRRGRPPGSGKKRGRPAGSGKKRGRPAGSGAAAGSNAGAGASGGGEGAAASGAKRGGRGRKGGAKKASASLSPEQQASRQLQGKYLALIRQIPAAKRGQYQTVAKEKGREAAIKQMQDVVGK